MILTDNQPQDAKDWVFPQWCTYTSSARGGPGNAETLR